MAKKISDLAAAAAFDGTEALEVVQAAGSKKGVIGAILPPGYIDGLKMKWVSGTALTVTTGAAYIPSLGRVVRVGADIAKTGLTLTASTWYHVYLWLNGANADIVISTAVPAAPYVGTARTMNGDTSKRYVGSVLTDASGNIFMFAHSGNLMRYVTNVNAAPFLVLSAGRAIAVTDVACSGAAPVTAVYATLLALNSDTTQTVVVGNSNMSPGLSSTSYVAFTFTNSSSILDIPLDSSQKFNYVYPATPSGAFFCRVIGYVFER